MGRQPVQERMVAPEQIVGAVRDRLGREISQFDSAFLVGSFDRRRGTTSTPTEAGYLARLRSDAEEAEAFIESLDVHHSELFREPLAFALLEERIVPDLLGRMQRDRRTELRVWSAGCAAGQEPYSLAIMLAELCERSAPPTQFRVFATDRYEDELDRGRVGQYGLSAMHNVRLGHLERWFTPCESGYVVRSELRQRVHFSLHELLDPHSQCPQASIYGSFDLVLCCNVLLYYQPNARRLIVDKLRRCLAPGGYLVTGATERELVLESGGLRAASSSVAAFRRGTEP